jgi:hypothetical protein
MSYLRWMGVCRGRKVEPWYTQILSSQLGDDTITAGGKTAEDDGRIQWFAKTTKMTSLRLIQTLAGLKNFASSSVPAGVNMARKMWPPYAAIASTRSDYSADRQTACDGWEYNSAFCVAVDVTSDLNCSISN